MENSNIDKNVVPSDINAHNLSIYHSRKRSRGPYYCTKCEHRVSYGSSFSNQGFGLMCTCCVTRESQKENLDQTTYIRKNVWDVQVPEKYFGYFSED